VHGVRATAAKLLVFALVSVLLFVGLLRMMSNEIGGDAHEWSARFTVVSGLRVGDDVRVAGVKVGRVESIDVVEDPAAGGPATARVRFTLRADQQVYEGTRLTLRYQNLLGQRYLALSAPTEDADRGSRLGAGTEIPESRTSPGFDLTALLNGFEPLFSVLEPAEVNELASNIVAVLQGESGTVESLLRRTADATDFLAGRDEVFGQVLANLTPVLENLDDRSADFDATVVQLRRLMRGLADERRTFGDSIDHLGGLVESTSSLLEDLRAPVRRDVGSLRRSTALLADNKEALARTVERLAPLLAGFARSMSYGGYLNVYLCNLGVEALGAEVYLGGRGGPYSKACR
jgi:phospholipid/cholesterol/gamma-HCH transport system substrate-binding protein